MKNILLIGVLILTSTDNLFSQDYLGLSSGNYGSIQSVMLQPANVADNRYQFEVNLVSTSLSVQNNYVGISRSFFTKNFFSFNGYDNFSDFKKRELRKNDYMNENVYLKANNRINLPSLLLTTGKNSGIALNIQSRTGISIQNLNPLLAEQAYDEWKNAPTYGQNYVADGLNINGLNWIEIGFTYGRVLINNEKHFLKAGITAKYLGGVSSFYFNSDNLKVRADNDSMLYVQSPEIEYGHSATNISAGINSSFRPDASAFGFDMGVVYEFRGQIDKFKFLKYDDDYNVKVAKRRDKNKYTFKVGVSLLDVGSFNFQSTPEARNFSINDQINLNTINIKNLKDLDAVIAEHGTYTAGAKEFSVALPTAFSAQVDVHLYKGFYVNGMMYKPVKAFNNNADFRINTPDYYAVTPRWESKTAGVYIPIAINNRNEISAGATLRVGPVFLGTSNLYSMLRKDNIKRADIHVGLKIPLAFGKPSKANMWLKKTFSDDDDDTPDVNSIDNSIDSVEVNKIDNQVDSVIVPKKETKKVKETPPAPSPEAPYRNPPVQPINIIINNYNSPGAPTPASVQTYSVQPNTGAVSDPVIIKAPAAKPDSGKAELDNIQKQIDSLKLQMEEKKKVLEKMQQDSLNNGAKQPGSKKKMTQ
jgi:hypothetical protein